MFTSASQLLGTAAAAYGVLAALAVLLQARQMLARRTSCEVSGRFFASYAGGYALWPTGSAPATSRSSWSTPSACSAAG